MTNISTARPGYKPFTRLAAVGPDAAEFEGTQLTVGYQIGYPVALAGATIVLNSPGLGFAIGSDTGIDLGLVPPDFTLDLSAGTNAELAGDIIPSQELDIDLEPGGITEVPLLEVRSSTDPRRWCGCRRSRFHLRSDRTGHHRPYAKLSQPTVTPS